MNNIEEKTASISAINAYAVLVLGIIGLKTAFSKEIIDFLPILLSVFLLILNNSVKYYNRVPSILAMLITMGLMLFFISKLSSLDNLEIFDQIRIGLMGLVSAIPIPYFFLLIKEKEFQ